MNFWAFDPGPILGLLGLLLIYSVCTGPLRGLFAGSEPVSVAQQIYFYLGNAALWLALVTPIATLGDGYLLTMHMVQHLLMTLIAPPLLLKGTPGWLLRPLLDIPGVFPVARFLTLPLVAYMLFNFTFSVWHVPAYYDLTLQNDFVHVTEHLLFFSTAVLTWWPIYSPLKELPPASVGMQVLYLFFQSIPPAIVGAMITFAGTVLYQTYADAPRIWSLTPLQDQATAGLIMWVPGGLVFFSVLTVIFFRWFGNDERDPLPMAQ